MTRIFAAAGFLVVDVDGMTFGQQVALFKDAEIVAGCMGAAMTNTVFCNEGATVLHLAPEEWMEPSHWDLAATFGHRHAAVYGQCIDPTVSPHQAAFALDTTRVSVMLNRLLG